MAFRSLKTGNSTIPSKLIFLILQLSHIFLSITLGCNLHSGQALGISIKTANWREPITLNFGVKTFDQLEPASYVPYGYEALINQPLSSFSADYDYGLIAVPFTISLNSSDKFKTFTLKSSLKLPKNPNGKCSVIFIDDNMC